MKLSRWEYLELFVLHMRLTPSSCPSSVERLGFLGREWPKKLQAWEQFYGKEQTPLALAGEEPSCRSSVSQDGCGGAEGHGWGVSSWSHPGWPGWPSSRVFPHPSFGFGGLLDDLKVHGRSEDGWSAFSGELIWYMISFLSWRGLGLTLTFPIQMFYPPSLLRLHSTCMSIFPRMGSGGICGLLLHALEVFLAGPYSNIAVVTPRAAAAAGLETELRCYSVGSSARVMKNNSLNESVGRG